MVRTSIELNLKSIKNLIKYIRYLIKHGYKNFEIIASR